MLSVDSTVKVARARRMFVVALITLALGARAPAIHESHAQDKTGADASKLTPDQKADQVTQHLKENKKKAEDLQKDPCPTTQKDWEEWKKKALEIWACVIASGSMGAELKKDGAGKGKLDDYEKERGSKADRKTAENSAIAKAIECAQSAGAQDYKDIEQTKDVNEAIKKGKKYADDLRALINHMAAAKQAKEAGDFGLTLVNPIKESANCEECKKKQAGEQKK